MFTDFLRDRCSIYHLVDIDAIPGYGIPTVKEKTRQGYSGTPDLTDVKCKLKRGEISPGTTSLVSPAKNNRQDRLFYFEYGANIEIGDKLKITDTGEIFYVKTKPLVMGKNHHMRTMVGTEYDYL